MVLGYILTIKLRKSPFDLSTCHHAHQELVKGLLTDYSGPFLALTEMAHWFEVVLLLGLCTLFWATSWSGCWSCSCRPISWRCWIDNVTSRHELALDAELRLGRRADPSLVNLIWLHQG